MLADRTCTTALVVLSGALVGMILPRLLRSGAETRAHDSATKDYTQQLFGGFSPFRNRRSGALVPVRGLRLWRNRRPIRTQIWRDTARDITLLKG